MFEWFSFIAVVIVILVLSKFSIGLALFSGGLILGLLLLPASTILEQFIATFSDPSIVTLALAIALIPMIGAVMDETGLIDRFVRNLSIRRRLFLALSPAFMGMLPMPGGALLSAPFIEGVDEEASAEVKSSINVWFRHIPQLIYPLTTSLIVSAKVANVNLYSVIPFMLPPLAISSIAGYWFILRKVSCRPVSSEKLSVKPMLTPLLVVASAPIADLLIKTLIKPAVMESATLAATSLSFFLALAVGKPSLKTLTKSVVKMRPWNFSAVIFGMFFFLNVFQASQIPILLASLQVNATLLCLTLGLLLGFITGRIQIPTSIAIPVFLAKNMLTSLPPLMFSSIYFSAYLGYIASPVHPCVVVSLEYFNAKLSSYLRLITPSTALCLAVAAALSVPWFLGLHV